MSPSTLKSPDEIIAPLATMFNMDEGLSCHLFIQEDHAFQNGEFLPLGTIRLFPEERNQGQIEAAIRLGQFEWKTPTFDDARRELERCLIPLEKPPQSLLDKRGNGIRRIMDLFGAIPVRLGLERPILDPHALEIMPFHRPTTVVTDTSAVLGGALNFVARYLCPAARINVPALTHVEIINLADRFLSMRRKRNKVASNATDLLINHITSQSGQRVLLSLEFDPDIEVERTLLLGDPLRNAFQSDRGPELRQSNVSSPLKSYADRLILESARRHQSQVTFGHPVVLLTSDQGLARMAMAEGIDPIFFRSPRYSDFFGKHLTGTNFHPFSGLLETTSLPALLWDLATIAGCARLVTLGNHQQTMLVQAIGDELAWAPYHSRDDLLWVRLPEENQGENQRSTVPGTRTNSLDSQSLETTSRVDTITEKMRRSAYRVSISKLIPLIDKLADQRQLSEDTVRATLGIRSRSAIRDYRRFLESGEAITVQTNDWSATALLSQVATDLRKLDTGSLRDSLLIFPVYADLKQALSSQEIGRPLGSHLFGRANSMLVALAEITEIGAQVHDVGLFTTPMRPTFTEFVEVAVKAYDRLRQGGDWVATGRWLEELIMAGGIHPNVARRQLQSASEAGLVRRTTEGSTTETAFDHHTLQSIGIENGTPFLKKDYLYRGDFLMPGKSSSSIKIEGVKP